MWRCSRECVVKVSIFSSRFDIYEHYMVMFLEILKILLSMMVIIFLFIESIL